MAATSAPPWVEKDGISLLAEDGSPLRRGADLQMVIWNFDHVLLKKSWAGGMNTEDEKKGRGKELEDRCSGGIIRVARKITAAIHGNAKARVVVWELLDPRSVHREPMYSLLRPDLVDQYPQPWPMCRLVPADAV